MGNRQGSNKNKKRDDKKKERDVKKQKGKKKSKNRNSATISERDSQVIFESSEDIAQGACAEPSKNTGTNSNHAQPDVLAGITFDPATRPRDQSAHGAWSSDEDSQLGYSTPLLRTPKTQRSARDTEKAGDLSSGEHVQEIQKVSELTFPQPLNSSPGEVRLRNKSESLSPAGSPGLSRDVRKKRALGQAIHENGNSKAVEAAILSAPQVSQAQNKEQLPAIKGTPEINIFGDDRDSLEDALCPWLRDDDASIDEDQLDDMFISCIDLSYSMADACSEKEFTGGSEADCSSLESRRNIKDRKEQRKIPAAAPSCYGEWEGSSVDPVSCKNQNQTPYPGYKPQPGPTVKAHHYKSEKNKSESEQKKVQQYNSNKSNRKVEASQQNTISGTIKSDHQQQKQQQFNKSESNKQESKTKKTESSTDHLSKVKVIGSSVDNDEHTCVASSIEPSDGSTLVSVKQSHNDSSEPNALYTQSSIEEGTHNKQNEAAKPTKKNGRAKDKKRKRSKTKPAPTSDKLLDNDSNKITEKDTKHQVSIDTGECESVVDRTGEIEDGVPANQDTKTISAAASEQHRFIGDGQTPADFAASVMSSMSETPVPFSVDPNPSGDPLPMSKLMQRITGFIREETVGFTREEASVAEVTRRRKHKQPSRSKVHSGGSEITSDEYSQDLDTVFHNSDKTHSGSSFSETFSHTSFDADSRLTCEANVEAESKENINSHMDKKPNPYRYDSVTSYTQTKHTEQSIVDSSDMQEASVEPTCIEMLRCDQSRGIQLSDEHGIPIMSDKICLDVNDVATSGYTIGPLSADRECGHIEKPNVGENILGENQDMLPSESDIGKTLPEESVAESQTTGSVGTAEGAIKSITHQTDTNSAGLCGEKSPDVRPSEGASTSSNAVPPPSPSAMDALGELDEEADEEDVLFNDQKSKEVQLFGDSVLKRLSYLVESQGNESVDEDETSSNKAPPNVVISEMGHSGGDAASSSTGLEDRSRDASGGDVLESHSDIKSSEFIAPLKTGNDSLHSNEKPYIQQGKDIKDKDITAENPRGMGETLKSVSHKTTTDADDQRKESIQNTDGTSQQSAVKKSTESETSDANKQDIIESPPGSDKKSGSGKRKGKSKRARARAKAKKSQANASNVKSEDSECKGDDTVLTEAVVSQSKTGLTESENEQTLKTENFSNSKNINSKSTSEQTTIAECSSPKVVVKRPKIPEELTHAACCDDEKTDTSSESNSDSKSNPPKRESQQITEVIDAYGDAVHPFAEGDKIKTLDKESQEIRPESVRDTFTKKRYEQTDLQRTDIKHKHKKKANNLDDTKEEGSEKICFESTSNPSKHKHNEQKEASGIITCPNPGCHSDVAEEKKSKMKCPELPGNASREERSEQEGGNPGPVRVRETEESVSKPKCVEDKDNPEAGNASVTINESSSQDTSNIAEFVDVSLMVSQGGINEPTTSDASEVQSPMTTTRPQVLPLQRVIHDNDQDASRESRASWELSDELDTTEESFENIDFPAECQSSSSADSVFRIPDISETIGEMDSVKNILDDFEDRTPQAESMPGFVGKELLKSQPDFLTVHRRSRMSPALTNRTESDLDVSEMRDDISTDSMYADDEGDGPLLFTKSYSEQPGGGVLMSCTIYNSSHNREDSDDFWEDCGDEAYHQIEVSADAASSTFQDARKQMHEIHEHLRTLRLQMETLAEDLENASITPEPEFQTESDDKRLVTD